MKVKAKCARALIMYLKSEGKWEGKLKRTLYNQNCIMQLADSVSVAKIKIIYASRQRAHSEPSALIWRSCAFNRQPMTMPVLDGPMTMPVLDGVKPMAITLPICGTSESLFWKRKKSIYCWTRSRPTWTFGESNDQVRVQIPTSPRQVRDDRKTSRVLTRVRDRTRVLQP